MSLSDTIIIAASFFGITLLAHILICKLGSSANLMLNGIALGGLSTIGCAAYMFCIQRFDITGPYLLFSAWLFYLMVLINLLNSVTLKMLVHLYNEPTGTLSVEDFDHAFNTQDGFETRLAMMHANQLIQHHGQTITLTPKARYLLAIVHQAKATLSID